MDFEAVDEQATFSFLDQDTVLGQWLGRGLFALGVAVLWHFLLAPPRREFEPDNIGNHVLQADEELKEESSSREKTRSLFLDRFDDRSQKEEETPKSKEPLPADKESKADDKEISEKSADEPAQITETQENENSQSNPETTCEEQQNASGSSNTTRTTRTTRTRQPPQQQQQAAPPPMKARHGNHPGLKGFNYWYSIETSLYRMYTLGNANGEEVPPSFIPKSERGHVPVTLDITNKLYREIDVFWVDYKGKEILRGTMKAGKSFGQTTWIGHPWTFRLKETGELVLHYIPYRVIPSIPDVPTVDDDEPETGVHRFAITRPNTDDETYICSIDDQVCPIEITTPQDAAAWSFHEMSRKNYLYTDTLKKYFTNIVLHPAETKYRQIRIANPRFFQQVWNTPARGLLLAAGFVEQGAYAELGCAQPLSRERVQEVSTLLYYMERWHEMQDSGAVVGGQQPEGADGFGRANYGRPGLNL